MKQEKVVSFFLNATKKKGPTPKEVVRKKEKGKKEELMADANSRRKKKRMALAPILVGAGRDAFCGKPGADRALPVCIAVHRASAHGAHATPAGPCA